ncbi:Carboxylic ester hydrolase protein [Rutstroemia sp. NJR-2017a BVV2]|nr:Carboxylic ester hydrolase protein [Rutstroemia sp. NJR-2017a BVV2]
MDTKGTPNAMLAKEAEQFLIQEGQTGIKKIYSPLLSYLYNWWLWEIISIFVSIIYMACIVVVLLSYHNRPIPSLPAGLTFNALISLLATLSKAAMLVAVASCISQLKWHWFSSTRRMRDFELFDQVSRGPWGSLCLITRTRSPWLVGLGAFITIIALGVEPFIQQIIFFTVEPMTTPTTSIISRAQTYDAGASLSDFGGGLQTNPDFGMKAAIYRGLFVPTTPMEVLPTCETGNCTSPLFDSLAFCSKCNNVTDQTKMKHYSHGRGDRLGPGDYNITASGYFFVGGGEDSLTSGPAMIAKGDMPEPVARSQLGIANPISSIAILQFPEVQKAGYSGSYDNQTPRAWQCALYFCLNTYNVTVINGITNSTILSSWHSDTGTPLPDIEELEDYGQTADAMLTRPEDSPVKVINNSNFPLKGSTIAAMAAYLNHTISGMQLTRTSEVAYDTWTNDVMQALTETTDIGAIIAGVAASATKYIREGENRGAGFVNGTSFKSEGRVHVRWAWIILPVLLALLSVVFLVATMTRAARKHLPVWKTSTLPALFHGIENPGSFDRSYNALSTKHNAPGKIRDMDRIADSIEVKLIYKDTEGWKLALVKETT